MSTARHAYVARCHCGHMVAVVIDEPTHRYEMARNVAGWIEDGLTVERVEVGQLDLARCRCARPKAHDSDLYHAKVEYHLVVRASDDVQAEIAAEDTTERSAERFDPIITVRQIRLHEEVPPGWPDVRPRETESTHASVRDHLEQLLRGRVAQEAAGQGTLFPDGL